MFRVLIIFEATMNKKTIDGVRDYYKLPAHITDEQIKKTLKGSLGEARVNLHFATNALKKAIAEDVGTFFRKYLTPS